MASHGGEVCFHSSAVVVQVSQGKEREASIHVRDLEGFERSSRTINPLRWAAYRPFLFVFLKLISAAGQITRYNIGRGSEGRDKVTRTVTARDRDTGEPIDLK